MNTPEACTAKTDARKQAIVDGVASKVKEDGDCTRKALAAGVSDIISAITGNGQSGTLQSVLSTLRADDTLVKANARLKEQTPHQQREMNLGLDRLAEAHDLTAMDEDVCDAAMDDVVEGTTAIEEAVGTGAASEEAAATVAATKGAATEETEEAATNEEPGTNKEAATNEETEGASTIPVNCLAPGLLSAPSRSSVAYMASSFSRDWGGNPLLNITRKRCQLCRVMLTAKGLCIGCPFAAKEMPGTNKEAATNKETKEAAANEEAATTAETEETNKEAATNEEAATN
jgi:hypothetical protein